MAVNDTLKHNKGFGFITRNGDKLMDGKMEFRFIGINTPNLHVEEDSRLFAKGWHRADEFEIRDVFKTLVLMGGTITRTYVFSVKGGRNNDDLQSHIYAPGKYDEDLFRDFDLVLKLANEYKIRLIVPFIDNWWWWGGTKEFAALEGKKQEDFCTDPKLIEDFKNFIGYVLNRTNTYTGVKYKDDPAILAWETGNELRPENANKNLAVFDKWTSDIAAFIKSIDKNHLVADGASHDMTPDELSDPYTDLVTEHYYGGDYVGNCIKARNMSKGKKVFYVGEFNTPDINIFENLLNEVVSDGTAGAMVWSLRFHTCDGGFYYHDDPRDAANPCYRWPGFASSANNEANKMKLIRDFAYKIRNLEIPKLQAPESPFLIPESKPGELRWRGSAGATSYSLERTSDVKGSWSVIDPDASEDAIPYVPYADKTAVKGVNYYYRVSAKNAAGVSKPSNIIGPINF